MHLQVKVRTGGVAGGAHIADDLSPLYIIAFRHREGILVAVPGGHAVAVIDNDQVAVAAVVLADDNGTAVAGVNG